MFHTINLPAAWLVVTSLSLDMLKDIDEGEISSHILRHHATAFRRSLGLSLPDGRRRLALALQKRLRLLRQQAASRTRFGHW
jgi:hypothetical protein